MRYYQAALETRLKPVGNFHIICYGSVMDDWIKLLTAVLGLLSAVVIYNKTKTKKVVDMGNDFKTLKSTLNITGTIALIMIIFFGYMLVWPAFFKFYNFVLSGDKKSKVEESKIELVLDNDITKYRIAFNAIQKIYSSSKRDEQYLKLLEKVLTQEEDNLVVNIIMGINSSKIRTNAINMAFDYYINNKKYFLATNIIEYYNLNSTREEKIIILLDKIYQDEKEQ